MRALALVAGLLVVLPPAPAQDEVPTGSPTVEAALDDEVDSLLAQLSLPPQVAECIKGLDGEPADPLLATLLISWSQDLQEAPAQTMLSLLIGHLRRAPQPVAVRLGDGLLVVANGVAQRVDTETGRTIARVRYRPAPGKAAIRDVLVRMVERERVTAGMRGCLANLRSLSEAARSYARDHEGQLPSAAWAEALAPYLPDGRVPTCPSDPAGFVGYAMNARVAGLRLKGIVPRGGVALFFESAVAGERPLGAIEDAVGPHDGQCCVGFADGHAAGVSMEELPWHLQLRALDEMAMPMVAPEPEAVPE